MGIKEYHGFHPDRESSGLFDSTDENGNPVTRSQKLRRAREGRQQQLKRFYELEAQNRRSGVPPSPRRRNSTRVGFSVSLKLQDAVARMDTREVTAFLNGGADSNTASASGVTLLHQCCIDDNFPLAEILVQRRANVNLVDDDQWTPLHTACACECTEIVQLLLNNGADVTSIDVDGNLPMDLCPKGTETRAIIDEFMFENAILEFVGADAANQRAVRAENRSGYDHASIKGIKQSESLLMLAEVKDFLATGGYVDADNDEQVTLLHIAAASNYIDVAKVLIRQGATVDVKDDEGYTPLHLASKYGHTNMVKLLLSVNANPRERNDSNLTPSDVASSDTIEELIKSACLTYDPDKRSSVILADIFPDETKETSTDTTYRKIQKGSMSMAKTEASYEAETRLPPDGSEDYVPMFEQPRVELQALINVTEVAETYLPTPNETDNLSSLPELTENSILQELMRRYSRDIIYTYVGDILIAINPFKDLPMYAMKASETYTNLRDRSTVTPHVFAVADRAYQSFLWEKASQCCIISGESGAGKTETAKYFVRHLLMRASSEESGMNEKIQQVNPLLEVFGNAKTCMNDNSSRFGKFIELLLTDSGHIAGARLSEYLLEKSRVTHQGEGEKNFHIFYLLFNGMDQTQKRRLGLQEPKDHRYLQKGDLSNLDTSQTSGQRFQAVKSCLSYIGFTQEDEECLFDILAAVILLGDLKFVPDPEHEGSVMATPNSTVSKLAELMRVGPDDLKSSIVSESITTRGEEIRKHRTKLQAQDCRDALAKAIYSRLFSWVVNNINILLQPHDQHSQFKEIGVLDIFGFENFTKNSFEQICINLANERLQGFFSEHIFQREKEDCEREGIDMSWFTFTSNEPIIHLFLERNRGIMDLLIEESHFPRGTDQSLANKLHNGPGKWGQRNYFTPPDGGTSFSILHYAGIVTYSLDGVVEKNRDTLAKSLVFTMKCSENRVVREMFTTKVTRKGSIAPSFRQLQSSQAPVMAAAKDMPLVKFIREKNRSGRKSWRKGRNPTAGKGKKGGAVTVANHFKNSLAELMSKMMIANPHFIRCIKPNTSQLPDRFVPEYVIAQLRYTGIMETTKIRRDGYPLRLTAHEFMERFGAVVLLAPTSTQAMSPQRCKEALEHHQINGCKIGKTKLFFKHYHTEKLQQTSYELTNKVITCQKMVRGYLSRKSSKHTFQVYHSETRAITDFLADLESKMVTIFEVVEYTEALDQREYVSQKQTADEDESAHMEEELIDDLLAVAEEEERKTPPTMEEEGPNNVPPFSESPQKDLDKGLDDLSLKTSTISSLTDSFNDLPDTGSEHTVEEAPPDEPAPPALSDIETGDINIEKIELPPPEVDLPPPDVDLPPPEVDLPPPEVDLPPPEDDLPQALYENEDLPEAPSLYMNYPNGSNHPKTGEPLTAESGNDMSLITDDLPPPPPPMDLADEDYTKELPSPPLVMSEFSEESMQDIAKRRNAFKEMERLAQEAEKQQINKPIKAKSKPYSQITGIPNTAPPKGPSNGVHHPLQTLPGGNRTPEYVNNQHNIRRQPAPPSRSAETRLSCRGRKQQQASGEYEPVIVDGAIPPPPSYPAPLPPSPSRSTHRHISGIGTDRNIPPPPSIQPPPPPTSQPPLPPVPPPSIPPPHDTYHDIGTAHHDPVGPYEDLNPMPFQAPPPPPPNHPSMFSGPTPPPLPPVSLPPQPSSMSQLIGATRLKPAGQRGPRPAQEVDPMSMMMSEMGQKLNRRRMISDAPATDAVENTPGPQKSPPPPTSPKPQKEANKFAKQPVSPPPVLRKPNQANPPSNNKTSPPKNGTTQPETTMEPIDPSIPPWKRTMLEKKRKEELAKKQEEDRKRQEEEEKWKDIPAWKKKMILEKEKKKAEAKAQEMEANRPQLELEAKLAEMPEWKRKVYLKKMEKEGDVNDNQQAVG